MEKTARIFKSFQEADAADRAYTMSLTPADRLKLLYDLNSRLWGNYGNIKGPERVCRLVKRPRS